MHALKEIAPAFVAMAHSIVWCSAATVDSLGRPRTRILHPYWEWDGEDVVGWIGVGPTRIKRGHLSHHPYMSCCYWNDSHDTCRAECNAELRYDDETKIAVWNKYKNTQPPLGYDPGIIPAWDGPTSDAFAVIKLDPWRLRVFPGTILLSGGTVGELQEWQA